MVKNETNRMLKFCLTIFLVACLFGCNIFLSESRRTKILIRDSGFIPYPDSMYQATKSELDIYDFKPSVVIADIGFGMAWLEGVILVHYDSLILYANDVDKSALTNIDTITGQYLTLRTTPNTNKLIVVAGSETQTNLPENTFDKILVRETFHHFSNPKMMLSDIHSKLKQDGILFIYEQDIEDSYFRKQCDAIVFGRTDLLSFFNEGNWELKSEHILNDSPGSMPSWWIEKGEKVAPMRIYVFKKR